MPKNKVLNVFSIICCFTPSWHKKNQQNKIIKFSKEKESVNRKRFWTKMWFFRKSSVLKYWFFCIRNRNNDILGLGCALSTSYFLTKNHCLKHLLLLCSGDTYPPSLKPTLKPTLPPSVKPTKRPTSQPSLKPTKKPSGTLAISHWCSCSIGLCDCLVELGHSKTIAQTNRFTDSQAVSKAY